LFARERIILDAHEGIRRKRSFREFIGVTEFVLMSSWAVGGNAALSRCLRASKVGDERCVEGAKGAGGTVI
jgi:hypothetical protein